MNIFQILVTGLGTGALAVIATLLTNQANKRRNHAETEAIQVKMSEQVLNMMHDDLVRVRDDAKATDVELARLKARQRQLEALVDDWKARSREHSKWDLRTFDTLMKLGGQPTPPPPLIEDDEGSHSAVSPPGD